MSGIAFIISGPSGVGKGSLLRGSGLDIATSWATRQPKPRDLPGEYKYVSKDEFEDGWRDGELLERDEHFGIHYGLAKLPEDKVLIADIDVSGALKLHDRGDVVLVGVLPPDPIVDTCLERLHGRGQEDEDEIAVRRARIEYEAATILAHWPHVIINDDLPKALRQLKIIIANSCRAHGIQQPK